jgi:hypothetical protein
MCLPVKGGFRWCISEGLESKWWGKTTQRMKKAVASSSLSSLLGEAEGLIILTQPQRPHPRPRDAYAQSTPSGSLGVARAPSCRWFHMDQKLRLCYSQHSSSDSAWTPL